MLFIGYVLSFLIRSYGVPNLGRDFLSGYLALPIGWRTCLPGFFNVDQIVGRHPGLLSCKYSADIEMGRSERDNNLTLKARQIPTGANIADLLAINGLEKWRGHMLPTKENAKKTTAILRAPNVEELDKILKKGYLVDNGKILPIVPGGSRAEDENQRTVLLVGTNKVEEIIKKQGGIMSELALLKTLISAGYQIQALNFIELGQNRIGHIAYVMLKTQTDAKQLTPFTDATSGVTLVWANKEDFPQICSKCLKWPSHDPKCSKHQDNLHRYATPEEIGKRAMDIDQIILGRFKIPKK